MKSRNSSGGIAVTELVYSQRVLLIGLTLSSHSTCTFVRPFGLKASESKDRAAKVRLCDFADIVFDHQGFADHLDVDRHASIIIRRSCAGRYVIGRPAALIFRLRQVEKPIGNVDALNWHINGMAEA